MREVDKNSMEYQGSNSAVLPKVSLPGDESAPAEMTNTVVPNAYQAPTDSVMDNEELLQVDAIKSKIKKAREVGYSDEELSAYLTNKGYNPALVEKSFSAANVNEKYKQLNYNAGDVSEQDKAMDIADLYKNIYSKYSTTGKTLYGAVFDSPETAIEARREINQLNIAVSEKLKKEGIDSFLDPDTGEVMMRDKDGLVTEVDSSIMNNLFDSKGETGGAIAGAITGASMGARGYAAGPIVGTVTTAGGALIGGAMGAMAGRGVDLAINSKALSEELSAKLYTSQMIEAGIFDGVLSVVGGTAIKSIGVAGKGVMKAFKYFTHGNPDGAYRALKENLNITDDQAKEMVSNWENLNNTKAKGTFAEQAISVISQTGRGAERAVQQAASEKERIATIIKQSVDERAKGLLRAVDTVADDNVGAVIRKDLKAYETDVKSYYGAIKNQAADAIDGTDFRFDFDKTAIKPVLANIEKKLSDPTMRDRFNMFATRVAAASQDRTFSGLLETRAIVNDFKFSRSGLSPRDIEALNTVINNIDGQVGKAVKQYMPDSSKQWIENFSTAKSEYAKMKQLQTNTLYRLATRKGATEKNIQNAISRYGEDKSVDSETFNQLVEKLPPNARFKVEGAALKNLVNKNTAGSSADYQAVHFAQLADDMKSLNIGTPQVKNLAKVIDEIAKVYKNDQALAGISGRSLARDSGQSIATTAEGKIKQGIVNTVWRGIMRYAPTENARNLALVHNVEKMFKDPLHAKTADDLLKQIPAEKVPEMRSLMKELQIEAAKAGPKPAKATINMYKQSATGKLTVTDGALGRGVYLVDKIKKPTGTNSVVKQEVDPSTLATLDNISSLLGQDVTEKEIRNIPNLEQQLRNKGFKGIKLNDKAMLFSDSAPRVKSVKAEAPARTVYRAAPVEETASELKPRSREFIYANSEKEHADKYGQVVSEFTVPEGTKLLDLSNDELEEKIFKDIFNGKVPKGEDKDMLMFDLHEGRLGNAHPEIAKKFKKYLKDNGYGGHSYGYEEAYLPGVLKDKPKGKK